ncbi:MAG: glycosyltransferase [Bacteroidetes bacterium]|jgi:GT2 family glycosyltransferase|nr:glycosyltransferase [Bacteroidota bacterium]
MKDFTIIIPTFRDWERLKLCVDKLLDQTAPGISYDIVVVNNDEAHEPPDFFRNKKQIQLLHEPTPGSYAARNTGASQAEGRFLAFTDADCIPDKTWLKNAHQLFNEQSCDMIGGRIDLFKPENGNSWAFRYDKHTAFRQHAHVPRGKCVTANLLIKRVVFDELNGFDASVKSGGDWEFSERAVSNGYTLVYGNDVVVRHPARQSLRHILKKQKRFAAWGYLNVKHRYGHSGLRIIGSNLLNGTPAAFRSVQIPESLPDKLIVLLTSVQIHFYKIMLQVLFLFNIIDPERIRE